MLSARYAGPGASNEQKIAKLLSEMSGKTAAERAAHFVCVITAARNGRACVVVSGQVNGVILEEPRGSGGFGYDPIFLFSGVAKEFCGTVAGREKSS